MHMETVFHFKRNDQSDLLVSYSLVITYVSKCNKSRIFEFEDVSSLFRVDKS